MIVLDLAPTTIEGIDLDAVVPCLSTKCTDGAVWATRRCPACSGEVYVCDRHRRAADTAAAMLARTHTATVCESCGTESVIEFEWRAL